MFSSRRTRKGGDLACIFVHAGAGYHSLQNENIHLQACNDAAKAAMAVMRSGGMAVDAVEIAIKILEDREITNAGYGSNLAMDGVVECDAIVIDQSGRSGGVGAVAQIKNPISLARLLLDHTIRTLSLRRVPPNFLAGQGATDFAYEHGMSIVPIDCLISPAARERWKRWRDDLDRAERNRRREESDRPFLAQNPSMSDLPQYSEIPEESEAARRAHMMTLRNGTWNEAQPISPPPSDDRPDNTNGSSSSSHTTSSISINNRPTADTTPDPLHEFTDPYGPPGLISASKNPFANSTQQVTQQASYITYGSQSSSDGSTGQRSRGSSANLSDCGGVDKAPLANMQRSQPRQSWQDGSSGSDSDGTTLAVSPMSDVKRYDTTNDPGAASSAPPLRTPPASSSHRSSGTKKSLNGASDGANSSESNPTQIGGEDNITDTVGAVAIDMYGNVACGASSGGIGMKHRGRIGPAALIGVGAHVIPVEVDDFDCTSVATVTSGTGEHMSTTQAAFTCSHRLYQNERMVAGRLEECGDDEAIKGFIEKDFMNHPSVKQSHSAGAIGVLSIKKTKDGAYLYFGHNTDSFALASMHSDEVKPVCTMSRSKGGGVIAQGGRAIRYRKRKP